MNRPTPITGQKLFMVPTGNMKRTGKLPFPVIVVNVGRKFALEDWREKTGYVL